MTGKLKNHKPSLKEVLQSISDDPNWENPNKEVYIDSLDLVGDSPLHTMVYRNDIYAVNLLIESKANLNAQGEINDTPLHIAVSQAHVEIIKSLLNAGAKSDIKSDCGKTAYEMAKEIGGEVLNAFK